MSELLRRHIVCLLAACLFPLAGCRNRGKYFGNTEPPKENVFRFNLGPEPEYLDPALMTALYDARLAVLLFEGLTAKTPSTGMPRPGVAEKWEISPDGLVYTFHLRGDAVWSDGARVTAQDFVYSWQRVLDPPTGSRYAYYLYPILNAQPFNEGKLKDASQLGFRALDDSTLEVRLTQPVPFFLLLLNHSSFYPVPRRTIEKYGSEWTRPEHIVTNGPFLLQEHRIHDRMLLRRNPRYWNHQEVRVERIIAYSIDDGRTAANMYEAGELDWVPYPSLPAEFLPYLRGRYQDLMTFTLYALNYYCFNVQHPPLDNLLVRRALTLAVDRHAITDGLLRGGDIPSSHFLPPGFPGYPSPPVPEYDPQRAAQLLAEAGYPGGKGFPVLEILVPTERRALAEAVQQMWQRNLHITTAIHNEEYATFLKRWNVIDYQIASNRWTGDFFDPATFADLMETGGGNNNTGWGDRDYDRLLAEARLERDNGKRMELFWQGQKILSDAAPVMPLYVMAANELLKPYVRGVYPARWDVLPLNQVWIDRDWQKHAAAEVSARD